MFPSRSLRVLSRRVAKHSGARRRREYLEETGSARAARAQGAQQDLLSRAAGPAVAGWLQVDTTANQTTMSATSPRHTRSAGAPVHPSAEAGFRPGDSIVCDYDIERTETWTGTVGGDVVSGLNVTWDPPVLRRQLNRPLDENTLRSARIVESAADAAAREEAAAEAAAAVATKSDYERERERLIVVIAQAMSAMDAARDAQPAQTTVSTKTHSLSARLLDGDDAAVVAEGPAGEDLVVTVRQSRTALKNWSRRQKKKKKKKKKRERGDEDGWRQPTNAGELRWSAVYRTLDTAQPSTNTLSETSTRGLALRMVVQDGCLRSLSSALPPAESPWEGQCCLDERWLQAAGRGPSATLQYARLPGGVFVPRHDVVSAAW